jgi:hypothetical protein
MLNEMLNEMLLKQFRIDCEAFGIVLKGRVREQIRRD